MTFTLADISFLTSATSSGDVLWSPTELGPQLWLDAKDASTYTLSGSTLTAWNDKSGRTQTTAVTGNPQYSATGLSSGEPAFTFDNTDYLTMTPTGFKDWGQFFCIQVLQTPVAEAANTTTCMNVWYGNNQGGANNAASFGGISTSVMSGEYFILTIVDSGSTAGIGSASYRRSANTAEIHSIETGPAGTGSYQDGVAVTYALSGNGGSTSSNYAPAAGPDQGYANGSDNLYLNARVNSGTPVAEETTMVLAESIYLDYVPSTALRQKIEGYLAHKWGLTAKLDAGHPYKSSPPLASSYVPSDIDAAAWVAAIESADGQALEDGVKEAYDTLVQGLKTDGIYSNILAFCTLSGARTLAGALVPMKGSAPINNNFVSNDYSRTAGLLGANGKYLNTNKAVLAEEQNSTHMAIYADGQVSTTSDFWGAGVQNGANSNYHHIAMKNTFPSRCTGTAAFYSSGSGSISAGLCGVARNSSSSFEVRYNGTNATQTGSSSAPGSANVYIFTKASSSGTPFSDYYTNSISCYSLGTYVSLTSLESRISTFLSDVTTALA